MTLSVQALATTLFELERALMRLEVVKVTMLLAVEGALMRLEVVKVTMI